MTTPLDLSQFVHDALTGPRQVESVKELTRSIAEASDADLLAEAVVALKKVVEVLEPFNFEGTWDDALEPVKSVLAKAKSLGGRA